VSWTVTPILPEGLILNQTTGMITGIPALLTRGSHTLTFTAQDSRTPTPQIINKQLVLTIEASANPFTLR
jgi:hypothetical protein